MKYPELKRTVPKVKEAESVMEIDETKLLDFSGTRDSIALPDGDSIERRAAGPFVSKALYLPSNHDYIVGKDGSGSLVLLVLKKN